MALLQPFIERAAVGMVVNRPAIKGQQIIAIALCHIRHPTAAIKDLPECFCVLL